MANHYSSVKLSIGEKTIAFCSLLPPKDLVVFIHGFNGDALDTWKDFPEMMTTHPKFQHADIVFWGYDSLKGQAGNLKIKFYNAVDTLSVPVGIGSYPNRNLPGNFSYNRVLIVAHSLGAVVTRLMLLHAKRKNAGWLDKCKLLFYAPAHWGSRLPENFKECFFGFSVLLEAFAVTKYPIIKDLTEGSSVLTYIKDETGKLLTAGKNDYVKAKVIWAEKDTVVINIPYCEDEAEDEILNTNHNSVCKPRILGFTEPFDHLLKII